MTANYVVFALSLLAGIASVIFGSATLTVAFSLYAGVQLPAICLRLRARRLRRLRSQRAPKP